MSSTIRNVAIAGATGNLGPPVVTALLAHGFKVKALSRSSSTEVPEGVELAVVDYASVSSLTKALQGQDAVISTLSTQAGDASHNLIEAAVAAGVKHYLPSEFGCDTTHPEVQKVAIFHPKVETQKVLEQLAQEGKLSYTLVVSNFFFDWGLPLGMFGLTKGAGPTTVYDGGDSRFTTTLLSDVGKAVAGILAHPEETKNRAVKIGSVTSSQNELLAIARKVGVSVDPIKDDSVDSLPGKAGEAFEKGEVMTGVVATLQSVFFRGGQTGSDYKPVDNELLGIKTMTEDEVAELLKKTLA